MPTYTSSFSSFTLPSTVMLAFNDENSNWIVAKAYKRVGRCAVYKAA